MCRIMEEYAEEYARESSIRAFRIAFKTPTIAAVPQTPRGYQKGYKAALGPPRGDSDGFSDAEGINISLQDYGCWGQPENTESERLFDASDYGILNSELP